MNMNLLRLSDFRVHSRKVVNQLRLIQIHFEMKMLLDIVQIWLLKLNFVLDPVYTHNKTEIDYKMKSMILLA